MEKKKENQLWSNRFWHENAETCIKKAWKQIKNSSSKIVVKKKEKAAKIKMKGKSAVNYSPQ